MGTRLWLCALKEDTVQLLLKDPGRTAAAIERVAKRPAVESLSPLVNLFKKLIERQRTAAEGDCMDIDKSWHGLHFLMTGTAWAGDPPLNFILRGGTEVAGSDGSTTRLYPSSQLREIHRALKGVDPLLLKSTYDPAAMMNLEIYPGIWGRDAHALDYCIDHFASLKRFVARADRSSLGMVTLLS
jgi:hypothetical protein